MYMGFDLSDIKFSRQDNLRQIRLPKNMTTNLAYETGVHIGDGHLTIIEEKNRRRSLVIFSGHYSDENEFYSKTISDLLYELYNIKPKPIKSTKNTIQLRIGSRAISQFKRYIIGLPNGNKLGTISIPSSIMESNIEIRKSCLAGIIDTDFSLSFRHGKYPRIGLETPIQNKKFIEQISIILRETGISHTICITNKIDKRYTPYKISKSYRLDINGYKNLEKYISEIGFRSSKHLTKLELWRRTGFCKPLSTYQERLKLLDAPVAQSVER